MLFFDTRDFRCRLHFSVLCGVSIKSVTVTATREAVPGADSETLQILDIYLHLTSHCQM